MYSADAARLYAVSHAAGAPAGEALPGALAAVAVGRAAGVGVRVPPAHHTRSSAITTRGSGRLAVSASGSAAQAHQTRPAFCNCEPASAARSTSGTTLSSHEEGYRVTDTWVARTARPFRFAASAPLLQSCRPPGLLLPHLGDAKSMHTPHHLYQALVCTYNGCATWPAFEWDDQGLLWLLTDPGRGKDHPHSNKGRVGVHLGNQAPLSQPGGVCKPERRASSAPTSPSAVPCHAQG